MQSAEDRPRGELTELLDRPMGWRILAEGQMRSERVVIARVGGKDPAQVGFAEDDRVIKALPRQVSPRPEAEASVAAAASRSPPAGNQAVPP